jgi:hypothetical protein
MGVSLIASIKGFLKRYGRLCLFIVPIKGFGGVFEDKIKGFFREGCI